MRTLSERRERPEPQSGAPRLTEKPLRWRLTSAMRSVDRHHRRLALHCAPTKPARLKPAETIRGGAGMALIERVKNMIGNPRSEWPVVAAEPATIGSIYTGYVLILAA